MAYEPIVDRIVQTKADGTVVRFIRGFINSDDPKPVTGIYDRSELYERDTGKWYLFNMSMGEWFVPDDNTGGGSGGGSGDVEADKVIASAYSTSGAYAAGSYVTKGGKLYKAKQTVSNEPWTAAHWEETKIMNEVSSIEPGTVLPDPSTGTNGMVVSVNNGEYVLANAPQGGGDSELPDPSQATEGNVLTVHNNAWIASAPQGGDSELPDASQATEGDVLTVHNGEWIASEPQGGGSGEASLSDDAVDAILDCFENVAWKVDNGAEYYAALRTALKSQSVATLAAELDLENVTIWSDDSINVLKQYMTVTATFGDSTTENVTDYVSLSGAFDAAASTVTVSYGGKSTTVSVPVNMVGNTNYASLDSSKWATTAASNGNIAFSDGRIIFSGTPQSAANNYTCYAMSTKSGITWGSLKGKTVRIRYTVSSPAWQGATSNSTSPLNCISVLFGCLTAGAAASGNTRLKWKNLGMPGIQLKDTYSKTTTLTLDTDFAWAPSGTGTVTDSSAMGFAFYSCTVNTWYVDALEVVEVLS